MATTTEKPATGSAAILDGIGSIVTRGSLTKVIDTIKTVEEIHGPGGGEKKKATVVAKLQREAAKRVPSLAESAQLTAFLDTLVELIVTEMNEADELDEVHGAGE